MKASIYGITSYVSPQDIPARWPVPPAYYDRALGTRNYQESIEQLALADALGLGFDWVSFSEHHFSDTTVIPSSSIVAAAVIGRIKRAKIAVVGPVLPLNNPVRVAEELAMLDNLSEGRLVVGMLRGTPENFQVGGVNPGESRERALESMELVLRAWTEPQPFSWEGRYFQFRTVSVWPRPLQQPFPPTFALGTSRETCEFAAQHGLGLGVSFGTLAQHQRTVQYYRECCAAAGWQPTPDHIIYRGMIHVAESDEQAEEHFRHYWYKTPVQPQTSAAVEAGPLLGGATHFSAGQTVQEALDRVLPSRQNIPAPQGMHPEQIQNRDHALGQGARPFVFSGSPATVVKQVQEVSDTLGAGIIDLWFQGSNMPHGVVMQAIDLFGKEVLPKIRNL